MARGRFISREICADAKVNDLSSDACRLAWTWLITHADVEGRMTGDPVLLCSLLFPRRRDITPEQMESWIGEWVGAGFLQHYKGRNGDMVIQLKNFEKHQIGLRKSRESPSTFPPPPTPEVLRSDAGNNRVKLKVKVKDNNKLSELKARLVTVAEDRGLPTEAAIEFLFFETLTALTDGYHLQTGLKIPPITKKWKLTGVTYDHFVAAIIRELSNPAVLEWLDQPVMDLDAYQRLCNRSMEVAEAIALKTIPE